MLAIIDYAAGNQTSVRRTLEHMGIACTVTSDAKQLLAAQGIIFPGVGAAGQAMSHLQSYGMDDILKDIVKKHKPLLGICLGCQILLDASEENNTTTLGIIQGYSRLFPENLQEEDGSPIRIPHMGWNNMTLQRQSCLFKHVPQDAEFYFVHSYYVEPDPELVIATTYYGHEFCSVYGRDGLWALQFHVEKSGAPGLQILQNFYDYCQTQDANNAQ